MKWLHFHKQHWTCLLIMAMLLTITAAPVHANQWVHEEVSRTPIASGAVHEKMLRFGPSGWQHINVVRMDLRDEYVNLELLQSSSGVSTKETLTTMMQQAENPVAGINADFFYLLNPDSPLGIMVRDGQIVSSPVTVEPFSSFALTKSGEFLMPDWKNHMYVSTEKGDIFSIKAYNKITWNYRETSILDRNWGSMSPGASPDYPDLVEVVVIDGQATEIRRGQSPTAIPADGYILLASGSEGRALADALSPGDEIIFHPQMVPRLEDIKLAAGGGTMLVRDGRMATFTEPVSGNHPRTAVGINRDGTELIMVTIDGRHVSYTGVDGIGLANLMMELGSYQALRMDSGGSTTMAVKGLGETSPRVVNVPSDGSQRRIINSLAVSSTAPQGALGGLLFSDTADTAFVNHPVDLAIKGYDTHYQATPVTTGSAQYRVVEGSGRIENNRLIPTAPGHLVVQATLQGKSVEKSVNILAEVAALRIQAPRQTVNPGETMNLQVMGVDPEGFTAPLSPERVQLSDDQNLGSFQNGIFQAGQRTGTTLIRAAYNGKQAAVPLSVGQQSVAAGSLESFQPQFLGYPSEVTGRVTVVPEGTVNRNALRLEYDLTGSEATTAAYAVFDGGGIPLPANTRRLAVQVHATAPAAHRIRGQLQDASGQIHAIDFKSGIDWTGWRKLEAGLPANLPEPVTLERLYVVETEVHAKTRGSVLFDGLEFLKPFTAPVLSPQERGGQVADSYRTKPEQADSRWLVSGGGSDTAAFQQILSRLGAGYDGLYLTGTLAPSLREQVPGQIWPASTGHSTRQQGDHLVISLDNTANGLRRTDFQQWPWLMNLVRGSTPDQLVFLLPKPITGAGGFTDPLEGELLMDQFAKLAAQGKQVFVFHGSQTPETRLVDGVRYVALGNGSQQAAGLYAFQGKLYYQLIHLDGSAPAPEPEPTPPPAAAGKAVFHVGQRFYTLGDERIPLDTAPYIKDDRLMVPVAHISRALGLPREYVEWDGASQTVLVRTANQTTLLMTIGSSQLWVEDQAVEMGVAAEITEDRSFVPISRFASAMEVQYQWNPDTQTVAFQ